MTRTIKSRADLAAYLAEDEIECLICGRRFSSLGRHLNRTHGVTPDAYRRQFGIPAGVGLVGQRVRAKLAADTRQRHETAPLNPDLRAASDAARQTLRGDRVAWELAEQAERLARMKRPILPPGARRADGRDADTAREAQRRRRSKPD